jgi:hypothetical protein
MMLPKLYLYLYRTIISILEMSVLWVVTPSPLIVIDVSKIAAPSYFESSDTLLYCLIPKVKALSSYERCVATYQTTRRNKP